MPLFSDGSDLQGVHTVSNIKYIEQLRLMSGLIDGWVKPCAGSQVYRRLIVVILAFSLIAGVVYLRDKVGTASAFDLGHQYISVMMITVAVLRGFFVMTEKYNELGIYFMTEFHLFNHKHSSNHAFRIHMAIHKLCHFYTACITKMAIGAFFLFNLRPIINNYSTGQFTNKGNSTFETSLFYTLPIDYESNLIYYVIVSIFNCYVSGSCLSYFVVVDTFISLMVFHLWGHIKVLTKDFENFPLPRLQTQAGDSVHFRYSEEESREVLNKLGQHMIHHNLIIDFLCRMSETFGGVLLVHYAFLQVCGCLMLLMCSPMDSESFARYGPLTVYCFQQLIQSSIIFELLDMSNDSLIEAIYNIPWECMNIKCKRIVYVLLLQSQRPMKLKAMDMITVGVQTMITILRTSFSYFLMIKTFAED